MLWLFGIAWNNADNSRQVTAETDETKPLTAKHMNRDLLPSRVRESLETSVLLVVLSLSLVDVVFVVACHGLLFVRFYCFLSWFAVCVGSLLVF